MGRFRLLACFLMVICMGFFPAVCHAEQSDTPVDGEYSTEGRDSYLGGSSTGSTEIVIDAQGEVPDRGPDVGDQTREQFSVPAATASSQPSVAVGVATVATVSVASGVLVGSKVARGGRF